MQVGICLHAEAATRLPNLGKSVLWPNIQISRYVSIRASSKMHAGMSKKLRTWCCRSGDNSDWFRYRVRSGRQAV